MVWWLTLCTFIAGCTGSIPGPESNIPPAAWCDHKTNKQASRTQHPFTHSSRAQHWKDRGEDSLDPQKAPQRHLHAQNHQGEFSGVQGPHSLCQAACQSCTQGSCLLGDTVPTSSPSRAYETQQPWWARSWPAFYTICWAERLSQPEAPNPRGQVTLKGTGAAS